MTEEQYHMVEHSFKHGNTFVFKIEERVFISDKIIYHRNKTITFAECNEVDESCFDNEGKEYWGDHLPKPLKITVKDPNPKGTKNSWWIASQYYKEDVIKGVKF